MESWKGGKVEGGKVERLQVKWWKGEKVERWKGRKVERWKVENIITNLCMYIFIYLYSYESMYRNNYRFIYLYSYQPMYVNIRLFI